MDAFKISIKLFAVSDDFGHSDFVPVFQHWIQKQMLPDHLLIDVADYAHVPNGPGTVLISLQANLYTDRADNRLGLLYSRKLPLEGTFRDRLAAVLRSTLKAATMLEQEPSLSGRLKFRADEWLLRINDRLLAPNTAETFAEVKPDVEAVAGTLYPGEKVGLEYKASPSALFEVLVKGSQTVSLEGLAKRLF